MPAVELAALHGEVGRHLPGQHLRLHISGTHVRAQYQKAVEQAVIDCLALQRLEQLVGRAGTEEAQCRGMDLLGHAIGPFRRRGQRERYAPERTHDPGDLAFVPGSTSSVELGEIRPELIRAA
jgi:hypothetical protein